MCVLLCEHGIACALRRGVAIVGVILIGHCSSLRGTPFQVQVMYRQLTLIRDRRCEEIRIVALRNLFVKKKLDFTGNILYIRELYLELL